MIKKADSYPNGFTTISNNVTRDNDISLGARGLLAYMLGCKQDEWEFSVKKLVNNTNTKKPTIEKYLDELEEKGYLNRKQGRGSSKNKGQFGKNDWEIHEIPDLRDDEPFGI